MRIFKFIREPAITYKETNRINEKLRLTNSCSYVGSG